MNKDPNMRPNGDGQRERELGSASRLPGQMPASLADREVSLAVPSPFEAMHRWLDGELSAEELAQDPESAHHVELWRRLGSETTRRGRERAPADLTARVMAALPGAATASQPRLVVESHVAAPVAQTAAPAAAASAATTTAATSSWWERPLEMNPVTALAAAAGLVTLGLVLGAVLKGS